MKITVSKKHIMQGHQQETRHCPVALAIKEATGEDDVSVGFTTALIRGKVVWLGGEVAKKIEDYDDTGKMKPFTFIAKEKP